MEHIIFTTEQKEQIRQNALAIERYIVKNVVPRLTDSIRLEFGGIHYGPQIRNTTLVHTLVVLNKTKGFYSEWNKKRKAYVGLETGFGPAYVLSSCYIYDLYDLLQNWQILKTKLEQAIENQNTINTFITNFEV